MGINAEHAMEEKKNIFEREREIYLSWALIVCTLQWRYCWKLKRKCTMDIECNRHRVLVSNSMHKSIERTAKNRQKDEQPRVGRRSNKSHFFIINRKAVFPNVTMYADSSAQQHTKEESTNARINIKHVYSRLIKIENIFIFSSTFLSDKTLKQWLQLRASNYFR